MQRETRQRNNLRINCTALVFFSLILVLWGVPILSAGAEPDPAADRVWSFWHPSSMGSVLAGQYHRADPLAALSLPHLHAQVREPRLAFAGGGSIDDGAAGGAAALIVPGSQMIWNGGLSFLNDEVGFYGRGVLAMARPLGGRLLGGIGANLSIAEADNDFSFGAGIDVGFRYDLGVLRELSRVDLHLALLNIGAAAGRHDYEPLVPAFTPVAGVRARVLNSESLAIDVSGSVRAAGFSRPAFDLGTALVFAQGVAAHVGWRFTSGIGDGAVWPGFSAGLRFPLGERDGRGGPAVYAGVQPDRNGNVLVAGEVSTGFETTDQEPPLVTASSVVPEYDGPGLLPPRVFLSPTGVLSRIEVDVAAVDNRGVREIETRIVDDQNQVIRRWVHAPMGSLVPSGTLTDRLVSDLWQRKITGTVHWDVYDGVPDGLYRMLVVARDLAGNTSETRTMEIVVDGTPPTLEATIVPVDDQGEEAGDVVRIIAGEDDGLPEIVVAPEKDVRFTLRYSNAERLSLQVVDQAGRDLVPLSAQPEWEGDEQVITLNWPGTERDGTRIMEGVYHIRAEARDALGNENSIMSPPLLIQSIRPRFTVAVSDTIVAPTGDGNRDTITVLPRLEPVTGLQEWALELVYEEGFTVQRWSGIDLPPEEIVLDGSSFPSDGSYYLTAVSRYRNGLVAGDRTATITVDRSPPLVNLIPDRTSIQPDLDPVLPLFIEPDDQAVRTVLYGRDSSGRDRMIREWARAPQRFDWQLLFADGAFSGPGEIALFLEAWDRAGNRSRSTERLITVLERLQGVGIVPERDVFGPTGNGRFDTLALSLDGTALADAEGEFRVDIVDDDDAPVRRYAGSLPLPRGVVWDGRNDEGIPVQDGTYRARLTVSVPDRGEVRSVSSRFAVDTQPPLVNLSAFPDIVSPDGDGRQDELVIRPEVPETVSARFRLFRGNDEVRARLPDPGRESLEWEPRLVDGTVLPDGDYTLVLEAEDDAGNIGRSEAVAFTVDTRPVSGFVRISAAAFSPAVAEGNSVTFTPVLPETRGIDRWEFILEPFGGGEPLLVWEGGGDSLPQPVRWEGEDLESGGSAPDGMYSAVLRARYAHGPVVDVQSPPVLLDATPPDVDLVVTPVPFSPDGDGVDDTVEFILEVSDTSPIRYWILEIFDPVGEFFYDVGGRGRPPQRIVWDGRARTGELVISAEEYPWRMEVADDLGNTTVKEGALQVDVLVERFGEGYRIQLPSITFPPDSAVLDLDTGSATGSRNRQVITRLAEILRRFHDYQIVIEGHAVNVSGTEREQREELIPLSRERAAAVRRALVDQGVSARLLSVEGRGGAAPIVPHSDEVNRWKNRRVDFLLKR